MVRTLPEPDVRPIRERPEIIEVFSAAATEGHPNGIEGDAWEWQLYVRLRGFGLAEIQTEVGLWYGECDRAAPLGMGRYLAQVLPNSSLHVLQDGGHCSTISKHVDEILSYLAG